MRKVAIPQVQAKRTYFHREQHMKSVLYKVRNDYPEERATSAPNCLIHTYSFPEHYQFRRRPIEIIPSDDQRFYRHFIPRTPWSGNINDVLPKDFLPFSLEVSEIDKIDFSSCQLYNTKGHGTEPSYDNEDNFYELSDFEI